MVLAFLTGIGGLRSSPNGEKEDWEARVPSGRGRVGAGVEKVNEKAEEVMGRLAGVRGVGLGKREGSMGATILWRGDWDDRYSFSWLLTSDPPTLFLSFPKTDPARRHVRSETGLDASETPIFFLGLPEARIRYVPFPHPAKVTAEVLVASDNVSCRQIPLRALGRM